MLRSARDLTSDFPFTLSGCGLCFHLVAFLRCVVAPTCFWPTAIGEVMLILLLFRYAYVDWLHYSWGALMINAFEGRDVQISGYEVRSRKHAALQPVHLALCLSTSPCFASTSSQPCRCLHFLTVSRGCLGTPSGIPFVRANPFFVMLRPVERAADARVLQPGRHQQVGLCGLRVAVLHWFLLCGMGCAAVHQMGQALRHASCCTDSATKADERQTEARHGNVISLSPT